MNPLLQLITCGQSYWIDNLTRDMIKSGALQQRVSRDGLRGVTSNPAIFHKAIAGSGDYDAQIGELVEAGLAVHDIYERLVVTDIQEACDILRPVYDATDGADGFVSLEVSPYLAHDTEGTVQEVRRLWRAVERPNVLIKIPGTPAGVPAIEQMLLEGININITLLFAIKDYEAVAHAYIRAMERRVAEGKEVRHVASVASFFLSRIDVLVDQLLGHRVRPTANHREGGARAEQLFGRVAIANAKLAYQSFKRIFNGGRWRALEQRGARLQRPLWASTSTKDPLYDDVRYVEPLIGPHTVNTMPDETIAAFADHGTVEENTIEADLAEARQILQDLQAVGIDLDFVTWQLRNEGAQKFIDPFDKLMQTLAEKRQASLGSRVSQQTISPGRLKSTVAAAHSALDGRQFARRLFARDVLLWTADAQESEVIHRRLGWLDTIEMMSGKVDDLERFGNEVRETFERVVLLGKSESDLCREACRAIFGPSPGSPQFLMPHRADPGVLKELAARMNLATTLFIVSSQSGTSPETLDLYRYFYDRIREQGIGEAGRHFVAITEAGSPLAEEARRRGFRRCFENPAGITGPFLALSCFNLVPLTVLGVDVRMLLRQARRMQVSCGPFIPAEANPGVSLGTLVGVAARRGRRRISVVCAQPLTPFGPWVDHLLSETLGAGERGAVAVSHKPLDAPETTDHQRIVVGIALAGSEDPTLEKHLAALEEADHPVVRIVVPEPIDLGAEFFRWQVAVATAGAVLGINPFLSRWEEKTG